MRQTCACIWYMNVDFFSVTDFEELQSVLSSRVFQGVLNSIPVGVLFLKPLRETDERVNGFQSLYHNGVAQRLLSTYDGNIDHLFSRYNSDPLFLAVAQLAEDPGNVTTTHVINKSDGSSLLKSSITKSGETILVVLQPVNEMPVPDDSITELLKKERELQHNKNLLQTVFNSSPHCITVHKAVYNGQGEVSDFEILMMNAAALAVSKNKQPIGKLYTEAFPNAEATGVISMLKDAMASDTGISIEKYYADGDIDEWFSINAVKLGDLVITTTEVITARKKAEEELKESKRLIEEISKITPDFISISDIVSQRLIYSNHTVKDVIGLEMAELYGMTLEDLLNRIVYKDDLQAFIDFRNNNQMKDHEVKDLDFRLVMADGSLRWFNTRTKVFKRDAEGNPTQMISFTQDIHEKRQAEEKVRIQLEIDRQAEKIASIGNWQWDLTSGQVIWAENTFKLLGYEPFSFEPGLEKFLAAIHPEDRERIMLQALTRPTEEDAFRSSYEYRVLTAEGEIRYIYAVGQLIKENTREKLVGTLMDVTQRKKAEDKIYELNKSLVVKNRKLESLHAELNTFNSLIASQYRETLQTLYTNLEFIVTKDAKHLSDAGKANVRRAQSAIQKLKLLTDDIVMFSGIHAAGNLAESVNLNDVMSTAIAGIQDRINDIVGEIKSQALPTITGFPQLLVILFGQLFDNAFKFRHPERPPIIQVKADRRSGVSLPVSLALQDTWYKVISIEDNGIGFPQEESEKIFETFYRIHDKTKYKGSGIGLAICRKIMELHGGFVVAESKAKAGSVFHCFFPE
ncbi:PAS domain-containing protein [Danxiaibacter flavus]|uniref:histidine kinase n=1 Tax=Danxiaibacter flavus TaxID=3049108 RepID=A0ABV3ZJV0_9BACT|nr:PAS domain-containing protein [Chitinophagaceae bacterium DXS]